ncbi:MAG: signal peptide peptidase SppA [FCB group bacterium]|nr:signal peptide peptidase SppA [FCB group bacterium]
MGEGRLTSPANPRTVNRWVWISLGVILVLYLFVRLFPMGGSRDGLGLGPKVGIVKLEGPIFTSERIVEELSELAEREDVKAIVLRINSPGGAVAPSQEIYEKVKSLRGQKPVVVSVGSMAASGGYYAALGSELIVANQGSITGSIGVILDYPVATELLDKIGLRFETVKSGSLKDAGSPTREVTDADRKYFQTIIRDLHSQFMTAVAENRNLALEDVKRLADGRVFTGTRSFELGLIDTLGTFEDALKIAGELGGIEGKPKTVKIRKKRPPLLEYLLGDLEQTASSWFNSGPAYRWRWE